MPSAPDPRGLPEEAKELLYEYIHIIERILDNDEGKREHEWKPEFKRLEEIEKELEERWGIEFGEDMPEEKDPYVPEGLRNGNGNDG